MEKEYLLGVDIGTSGSKGVIISSDGKIKADSYVEHELSIPQPGWAEHDADKVWWNDFKLLLESLTRQSKIEASQILAVGVSALCPDLLLIDKKGSPLRPAILYGIDSRAYKEIEYINQLFGKEYIFNTTGNTLSAQSLLPKLLWVKENEPDILQRSWKFLTASSYILYKLTGNIFMDYLSASVGGLTRLQDSSWVTDMFETLNISLDILPGLDWATEIGGGINRNGAAETGLNEGVPVIIGTCDVAAEAISAGVFEPGETILVYGSTISYLQCLNKPLLNPSLFSGIYCLPDCYFRGGATATAGSITKWFRDNFAQLEKKKQKESGVNAYKQLSDQLKELSLDPTGLLVLPFFTGARSPLNDENAKGIIAGLTLSHNKNHIYKALLEGVGYEIRHNLEVLKEDGFPPSKIISVGGGTKSRIWTQIVSDITGVEQYCVKQQTGAPLGAAFLAGLGSGIFSDVSTIRKDWIDIGDKVQPNPVIHEAYQKYYKLYREMYKNTRDIIHKIN